MSGNNFILSDFLDNVNICDDLIDYYENKAEIVDGLVGNKIIDKKVKSCKECYMRYDDPILDQYHISLQKICVEYMNKYNFCARGKWAICDDVKIQKYDPGDAYYAWHFERIGREEPMSSRHLVFLTYLNDLTDEGETEFYYQQIKFRPQKGLTLIWPAEWTHTHRGVASPTETKYIVTGWYNYMTEQ